MKVYVDFMLQFSEKNKETLLELKYGLKFFLLP